MDSLLKYLPIADKEKAGPRIIIFSLLLFFLSVILLVSNINFLLDPATPFVVNASNFLIWAVIFGSFLYVRTENRMRIATMIILSIAFLLLFGGLFTTGGMFSVDTAWAIFMILVAYLFSGIMPGIIFTFLTLAGLTVYYYGEKQLLWEHGGNLLIVEPDYVFSTLACIIVVLSVILFAFVKTLNTLQEKNKKLTDARFDELSMMLESRSREIETLRNKLARDFHDQTGGKLVMLKTLAGALRKQPDLSGEMKKNILLIEKNAGELYAHTRDFIWSIDSRNSSMDEIMLHLTDFGNTFFSSLNIDFETQYDLRQLREYIIPVEHVMQLILLFKEAMTNSGKYSACKRVLLSCESTQEGCIIEVTDDGKGFDKNHLSRKGGLRNMEERGLLIGAEVVIVPVEGTGTTVKVIYPTTMISEK